MNLWLRQLYARFTIDLDWPQPCGNGLNIISRTLTFTEKPFYKTHPLLSINRASKVFRKTVI